MQLYWDAVGAIAELVGFHAAKYNRRGLIDQENLSKEELGRFDLIMLRAFQTNTSVYQQSINGSMVENAWTDTLRLVKAPLSTPGGWASWMRQKSESKDDSGA